MRRGLQVIFASLLCFLFFAYPGLAQEVRGPKVFLKDRYLILEKYGKGISLSMSLRYLTREIRHLKLKMSNPVEAVPWLTLIRPSLQVGREK